MVEPQKKSALAEAIAIIIIILMATGTIFVFSAGASITQQLSLKSFYDFQALKQIMFFPLAVAIMYGTSMLDYKRFKIGKSWLVSPVGFMLILTVILLTLVLFPQLGSEINRARRWFRIPLGIATVSFQPSELAKWVIIIFLAAACEKLGDNLRLFWKGFIPICATAGLVIILILIEDFGTAALICLLALIMLILAGAKWWHPLTPLPFAIAGFALMILQSPWRMKRIMAFFNPETLANSAAYQPNQSLIAIGSGGPLGQGLGRGICKYGHLPEDTTDFIFAIIGEELGFVGTSAILILFIAFIVAGTLVVLRCRDEMGKLLAAGIVLAIAIQAALNIGVVTVVLPTKGIALPFVSAGGTSILLSAAAIGILINIAKQIDKTPSGEIENEQN